MALSECQKVEMGTDSQEALILMVYDGAIRFSQEAKEKLKTGDLEGKGIYINNACNAISELRKALDLEVGKEIASSLDKPYSFMGRQLTLANIKNDPQPIDIVITLLTQPRDAWDQITRRPVEAYH